MDPLLDGDAIFVVVPDAPGRDTLLDLLRDESAELVAELGVPVRFDQTPPGAPGQLEFILDGSAEFPELRLDRDQRRVEVRGATLDDCAMALNLLRTTRRTGMSRIRHEPAATLTDAIERVFEEVRTTWPSFDLAEIDWEQLSEEYRPLVTGAADPIGALQQWVARLGDGHTNVYARGDIAALPYLARMVDGEVVFADVPVGTKAWEAGVRRGDRLLGVDTARLAATAGAPPRLEPWFVGRRALSGVVGEPLELPIRREDGSIITVSDVPGVAEWPDPIEWRQLPSGSGYLRIRRWLPDDDSTIGTALDELGGSTRLIVDLRGNAGGTLVAATAFRRRFVPRPARLGSVRFSMGDGRLSPPSFYDDQPSDRRRWTRPVRFITDALTYSSSEDALLGLSQFDHVEVVGEPSGGGSGRPRTVALIGASLLRVSTALTYDHLGRRVERNGIHVDRRLRLDDDTIARADHAW